MMRMLPAGIGLLIACAGCVSSQDITLDSAASKIKVVRESDKPLRCKTLADVHGSGRAATDSKARDNAQNDLRNAAVKYKGANYVVIEADRGGAVGTTSTRESFLNGKVLACKEDETAGDPSSSQNPPAAPATSATP